MSKRLIWSAQLIITIIASLNVAGLLFSGCSDRPKIYEPPPTGQSQGRPRPDIPAGLGPRVDQYSELVNSVTESWTGTSANIDEFLELSSGLRGDEDDLRVFGQTVAVALPALAEIYGRLLDSALRLDELSYVSSEISDDPESAASSLNNPQWTSAMLARTLHGMRMVADLYRYYQIAGAEEMAAAIASSEDDVGKLGAYVVYAHAFNSWVATVYAGVGLDPADADSLPLDPDMTPDDVPACLAAVGSIIAELPLGVTLSRAGRRGGEQDSDSFWGSVAAFANDLQSSFLGTVAETIFGSDAPQEWMKDIPSTLQGLRILLSDPKWSARYFDINFLKAFGIGQVVEFTVGVLYDGLGVWGDRAACALDIGFNGVNLGGAVVGMVAMTPSVVGSIIWGTVAVNSLNEYRDAIHRCNEAGVFDRYTDESVEAIMDAMEAGEKQPGATQVAALTNPENAECDQIRRSAVSRLEVKLRNPRPSGDPPFDQLTVEDARDLLSLVRDEDLLASTFDNLENSVAALILDHGARNPSAVDARVTDDGLEFYATDFALLVRREPGTTEVTFPLITDAELICSSPGYIPAATDGPVDIGSLDSLPDLLLNDGVSGGGAVIVE